MASNTIDYIVSIVIVTALLTSSILLTAEDLNRASVYLQDQQISYEAADILNNILQNSGSPVDWGQTNSTPISFGLNKPFAEYMMPSSLSPFTPMRLMKTDEVIIYDGIEYRNLTAEHTNLFLRLSEYLDYDQAADLLAVDTLFGFQVSMRPILDISIVQLEANPLKVGISLQGLSGTVVGALLNASLFHVIKDTPYPSISTPLEGHAVSDITGSAEIEFPSVNATEMLYMVLVKANLGGISGIGYYTNAYSKDSPLLPIVTGYQEGEVSLVHRKNIAASYSYAGDVYYNLTFINQAGETAFRSVTLGMAYGTVNMTAPGLVSLSVGNPGILLVSSKTETEYGLTAMPWGITPFCLSMTYGADPINKKTVVTKSQSVSINGLSYQIELALWRFTVES